MVLAPIVVAQPPPSKVVDPKFSFRTDFANGNLPWFKLVPNQFPPPGSAHEIGGELIGIDRVNRTGTLRFERTDYQQRGNWDMPLHFTMLPYGSVWYRGAPAELRDIPLGTHLIGQFYWDDAYFKNPKTKEALAERRISLDSGFHQVVRFEDDFSYMTRLGRMWLVETIDLEKKTITATPVGAKGESIDAKPGVFQVNAATRFWKGKGVGSLADLKVKDTCLINFTFRTMRLDGRCTDIWHDAESRALATSQQMETHRLYQREHGLAGQVEAVDDKARKMTVTLFDGFDLSLKDDFAKKPTIKDMLVDPYVSVAVAEESLRAYDPINDTKRAKIVEWKSVPVAPGCSGWQITLQPDLLLEGFRPGRIVRLFAGVWGVTDLPREEKLFP